MPLSHPTTRRAGTPSAQTITARRRRSSTPITAGGHDRPFEALELARDIRALIDAGLIVPVTDGQGVVRYVIDNNNEMENE